MPNRDDVQQEVVIPEAEIQANVAALQAALVRAGRATAKVCSEYDCGRPLIYVEHGGWKFDPHADGVKRGMYLAIAPGEPPDPARVDEIATRVREYTKAQPGDSLATWEATVLALLRRAMAEHPELHRATVAHHEVVEAGVAFFQVETSGKEWRHSWLIRRGPLVADIETDCRALAKNAARAASNAREAAAAKGDPDLRTRAMAYGGDVPLLSPETRHESPPCAAFAKPTSERTPLPPGWSWDDDPSPLLRPCVNGPKGSWALVELGDDLDYGRIETSNSKPAPPAIHNALVTEASRLGLVCHEKLATAPEGYRFKVDSDGDVKVEDRCGAVRYYWSPALRAGLEYQRSNTDPWRWGGWEPARQWAAYMLGEVAPPLLDGGAPS